MMTFVGVCQRLRKSDPFSGRLPILARLLLSGRNKESETTSLLNGNPLKGINMLVLSRRKDETIVFPELGITVEVIRVDGNKVRLGIKAPESIRILRGELEEIVTDFDNANFLGSQKPYAAVDQVA